MSMPPALVPAVTYSVHTVSAVLLVGGLVFARVASIEDVLGRALDRFRPVMIGAMVALVASGLYNAATAGGRSRGYHILFGIKVLLALHVFAAALLASRGGMEPRVRVRRLSGILVSGVAVVVLGVVLRYV